MCFGDDTVPAAVRAVCVSEVEKDRAGKMANVVDGLFAIADAIVKLASAQEEANMRQLKMEASRDAHAQWMNEQQRQVLLAAQDRLRGSRLAPYPPEEDV